MRASIFLVALVISVAASTNAAERRNSAELAGADPCKENAAACRGLAIEIIKLDFQEFIERRIIADRGFAALCPDDNPQCCPEELLPVCAQIARDRIVKARSVNKLRTARLSKCQFSQAICSELRNTYCDEGDSFDLQFGCLGEGVISAECPYPFNSLVFDTCVPPTCLPGYVYNGKKCVAVDCNLFGVRIPCRIPEAGLVEVFAEAPIPKSNLSRQVRNPQVQLEAAKQLREEMIAALGALDELIEQARSASYK